GARDQNRNGNQHRSGAIEEHQSARTGAGFVQRGQPGPAGEREADQRSPARLQQGNPAGRGREESAYPRGRRLPAQADQRSGRRCCSVQRLIGGIHQGPRGYPPPHLYRDPAGRHAGHTFQDYCRRTDAQHSPIAEPRLPKGRSAMNRITLATILAVLGIGTYLAVSSIYTVSEVEQAIIPQFGKPVGGPVTTAGLKVKAPFIQDVNLIDKRVLEWDGNPTDMPTKDKLYVSVDLFARWRIVDPLQYFLRLHDERSAQSRLDDILGSETRNAVAKHELIEIIRTTKERVPLRDTLMTNAGRQLDVGSLVPIQKGRKLVEQEIFAEAAEKVRVFGIELLDIR